MKVIVVILCLNFFFLLLEGSTLLAQTTALAERSSNGKAGEQTEVIFSVDPKNNKITDIFIREGSTEQQLYQLKQQCYRCSYYTGNLEGSFNIKRNFIVPRKGTTITIYAGKDLMTEENFNPGPNFKVGSSFPLAGVKTTVISHQQGVMVLKVN